MKILLIAPANGKWQGVARAGLFNGKTFRFSLLSLLSVAAVTSADGKMRQRIFVRDWSLYDFHHPVFRPSNMTPVQLQAGHDWVTRQFYRPRRILRRLRLHLKRPRGLETLKYMLALNMAYCGRIHSWRIRGWNPARHRPAEGTDWMKQLLKT